MESRNGCPKCGSEQITYLQGKSPRGKASGERLDLEVHPFLCRCLKCGEVFPGDYFPDTAIPGADDAQQKGDQQ